METNEAAQATVALKENALEGNNPNTKDALIDVAGGDEATT